MLSSAIEPVTKTALMYRAHLSFMQLKEYLAYLAKRQLLEMKGGLWIITERGRIYLDSYEVVGRIVAEKN